MTKPAPKEKKVKRAVDLRIEEIEGDQYLIVQEGDAIHQIDLRAVSSWGLLLGLTDPSEIVRRILRFEEKPVGKGKPNLWTPLYETLGEGLDQMSRAGVPAEYMEDMLDPALGSPIPGTEILDRIAAAQTEAVAAIDADPEKFGDISTDVGALLESHGQQISEMRTAFVDALAPVYEIAPPIPPASVPEAMDVMNQSSNG
jgi:hypothetical protein